MVKPVNGSSQVGNSLIRDFAFENVTNRRATICHAAICRSFY